MLLDEYEIVVNCNYIMLHLKSLPNWVTSKIYNNNNVKRNNV